MTKWGDLKAPPPLLPFCINSSVLNRFVTLFVTLEVEERWMYTLILLKSSKYDKMFLVYYWKELKLYSLLSLGFSVLCSFLCILERENVFLRPGDRTPKCKIKNRHIFTIYFYVLPNICNLPNAKYAWKYNVLATKCRAELCIVCYVIVCCAKSFIVFFFNFRIPNVLRSSYNL